MAEYSAIEWTDHTFNPWEGCQKVGPGCDHCYAEARNARFGGGIAPNWGRGAPRRRTSASNWHKPLKWQAESTAFMAAHGRRQRVFCASLADVFDNAVDPLWRCDLATLIEQTPDLDWLLLTKRIGNAAHMLYLMFGRPVPPPNVWLGATIVNQAEANRDIPKLLVTSARVRFLSMEPLLGSVDLTRVRRFAPGVADQEWINAIAGRMWTDQSGVPNPDPAWQHPGRQFSDGRGLDWIIVGGESGTGARPMHPEWARSLRDQCAAAGVPFLFKQWGEWQDSMACTLDCTGSTCLIYDQTTLAWRPARENDCAPQAMCRVGKKLAGRLLDGVTHDGFPV